MLPPPNIGRIGSWRRRLAAGWPPLMLERLNHLPQVWWEARLHLPS
jgi:hypothetical protein